MTADRSTALDVTLRNDLAELERLAALVEMWVDRNDLPPDLAFYLNLVLDELLTNTISYGYPAGGDHEIAVALDLREGEVFVRLADDGLPFDPFTEAPEPDLESDVDDRPIGGLGVHFVNTFMDDRSYRRDGDRNVIELRKTAAVAAEEEPA